MNYSNAITDIPGIKVGHATDHHALTGCTVILCPEGAVGGIDQRGGAPGSRETDLLRPMHLVEKVHGIILAGGSAFGLDAASGVMKFLEEQSVGFNTGTAKIPIVPSAILYDLGIGNPNIRPDALMGYRACQNASSAPPQEGNFGAGTGCTVGKILGPEHSMKTGIGTASIEIFNDIVVGAIVAVNAFGDVINPENGKILAGARVDQSQQSNNVSKVIFADTMAVMREQSNLSAFENINLINTVIGVVATNGDFSKDETNKIAQMAHNGLARTIRPAHTMFDGDTIFALSIGGKTADVSTIGAFAAEAIGQAVLRATMAAESVAGLPSANDTIKN